LTPVATSKLTSFLEASQRDLGSTEQFSSWKSRDPFTGFLGVPKLLNMPSGFGLRIFFGIRDSAFEFDQSLVSAKPGES